MDMRNSRVVNAAYFYLRFLFNHNPLNREIMPTLSAIRKMENSRLSGLPVTGSPNLSEAVSVDKPLLVDVLSVVTP